MVGNEKIIELKLDVDGVYKAKNELKKNIRTRKKVERSAVNAIPKVKQFMHGFETGMILFEKIDKILR